MFGSSEYLYDRFEKTKTAVKRAPYITGAVIGIILIICLFAIFHGNETEDNPRALKNVNRNKIIRERMTGKPITETVETSTLTFNEPGAMKIASSNSSHFNAQQNTKVPAIERPKIQKPKAQERTTAKSTTTTTWISTTTLKYFTIFDAVSKGEPKDVEILIKKGENVNKQNELGETALHLAIKRGSESIAKLLLENGANGNVQDNNGYSPLALAIRNDRQNIAHLILEDVNFGISSWNKDVLGHKACNVSEKLADAFSKKGINIRDDVKTILQRAISKDDEIETKLILDNCIGDINGNKDIQALSSASESCENKVASMLINNGANVNVAFGRDWHPLHVATYNGCKDIVKMLIDAHADLRATTSLGFSPLRLANDRPEIKEMLMKAINLESSN